MITFASTSTADHLLGHDLGATLAAGERRILESLFMLHRKLDALDQSDAALTTATSALGTQLQAFEADITSGLASVVAALKNAPQNDPAVDAATTALNAMGVGITGTQAAFDAAVTAAVPPAQVPTPSVPTVPAPTAVVPGTDPAATATSATAASATTQDAGIPAGAPIAQPVLDAMAANAVKAPEQSA